VGTRADAELAAALTRRVPGVVSVTSNVTWDSEEGKNESRKSTMWTVGQR
jgi:hypothetical protein